MKRHSGLLILLTLLAIFAFVSCSDSPNSGIPGGDEQEVPVEQPSNIPYKVVSLPTVTRGEIPAEIYEEVIDMNNMSYPIQFDYGTKVFAYNDEGELILEGIWDIQENPESGKRNISINYKVVGTTILGNQYKWIKPGIEFTFNFADGNSVTVNGIKYPNDSDEFSEYSKFYGVYTDHRYTISEAESNNRSTFSGVEFDSKRSDVQYEDRDFSYYYNYIDTYTITSEYKGITEIQKIRYCENSKNVSDFEETVIKITGGEYEGVYSIPENY